NHHRQYKRPDIVPERGEHPRAVGVLPEQPPEVGQAGEATPDDPVPAEQAVGHGAEDRVGDDDGEEEERRREARRDPERPAQPVRETASAGAWTGPGPGARAHGVGPAPLPPRCPRCVRATALGTAQTMWTNPASRPRQPAAG